MSTNMCWIWVVAAFLFGIVISQIFSNLYGIERQWFVSDKHGNNWSFSVTLSTETSQVIVTNLTDGKTIEGLSTIEYNYVCEY